MSKIIDGIAKDLKAIPETLRLRLEAWIKRSSFL